ncbi:MAG: hypothetical protein QM770_06605 [Tepidisphaeraceae bacterium]
MDETQLIFAFLFGLVGMAFFAYGRRAGRPLPLMAGVGLMVVPGFLPVAWGIVVASGLIATPWLGRNLG